MKVNPCKQCGSIWHTKMYHNKKKRISFKSKKYAEREAETREAWFVANPPDEHGYWYCYIPKHPNCPHKLTAQTIRLEHDLSKVRRPDLRWDITNIYPACDYDNKAKGSLSAEEYMSL